MGPGPSASPGAQARKISGWPRGGVTGVVPQVARNDREVILMQRKADALGKTLGRLVQARRLLQLHPTCSPARLQHGWMRCSSLG